MRALCRSLLLATLSGVLLMLFTPGPAQAHAELLGTTPKAGATVKSPSVVVLQFDEPVLQLGLTVQVTGPSGRVDDGPARRAGAGVLQPLKTGLAGGSYRVIWRVTSDDGHPVQGSFSFTATGKQAAPTTSPGAGSKPTGTATAAASSAAPSASGAASTDGPLPTESPLAAAPTSGGTSSTTRWTVAGVVIVVLALLAGVIASRRPRNRGGHANS